MLNLATDKRQFTLRVQEHNFEKIKYIAGINKRSIAMEIEFIMERYIKEFEKENGSIPVDES